MGRPERKSNVEITFERYIQGTPSKSIVRDLTIIFCSLTNEVQRVCNFETPTVYITTKVLKKNYDKRPAEQNDFIIKHGWKVVHMPSDIYKNKDGKRGDFLFAKRLNNDLYVCSLEIVKDDGIDGTYAVSLFRVNKESYLNGYELIWSWKGGEPSS